MLPSRCSKCAKLLIAAAIASAGLQAFVGMEMKGAVRGPEAKRSRSDVSDVARAAEAAGEGSEGKVVILGAGLQGAALAYYLTRRGVKPLIVEREKVAAAASGKGGGFLARDWGDSITRKLHTVSFQLHEELAEKLKIESYRKLPVLSVSPGKRSSRVPDLCEWLDGDIEDIRMMDPNGAQVAPLELCTKLIDAAVAEGAELLIGAAEGVETEADGDIERVTGVVVDGKVVPAEKVCVCLGPWAALAQDWFNMPVPMTGVKSSSIVYKSAEPVKPFAVFCGEDPRYGTHLEIYPRNSGEVYICGIGGSEYVDGTQLRRGELPPSDVKPDPARVKAATACFSEMSHKLGGEPDVVQACMRPCPPDALPIMGKVPHVRGAYISAGHNCWGILWAPVSGLAMSELILDGAASCVDLRHFSPARFAHSGSAAALRGRKMGAVPVGEQW